MLRSCAPQRESCMKKSGKLKMAAHFVRAAAAPVAFAASSPAWAQQGGPGYGPHMWEGGSWMFFGPMMMFLVIVVIVAMVVLLARWLGGSSHGPVHHRLPGQAPLDILKERFARGEIDKDEYEERRRVLGE